MNAPYYSMRGMLLASLLCISITSARAQNVRSVTLAESCTGTVGKIALLESQDLVVAAGNCDSTMIVRAFDTTLKERWRIDETGMNLPRVVDVEIDKNGTIYVLAFDTHHFDTLTVFGFTPDGRSAWRTPLLTMGSVKDFDSEHLVLNPSGGVYVLFSGGMKLGKERYYIASILGDGSLSWRDEHQIDGFSMFFRALHTFPMVGADGSIRLLMISTHSDTTVVSDRAWTDLGDHIHSRTLEADFPRDARRIAAAERADGGVAIAMDAYSASVFLKETLIFDATGILQWTSLDTMGDYGVSRISLDFGSDNALYEAVSEIGMGGEFPLFRRYDQSGDIDWERAPASASAGAPTHGCVGIIEALQVDQSDDISIVGTGYSDDLVVERYDAAGALEWHGTYEMGLRVISSDMLTGVRFGANGAVYVSHMDLLDQNEEFPRDYRLIRLAPGVASSVADQQSRAGAGIFNAAPRMHPNLVADESTARYSLASVAFVSLDLYNTMGEKLATIAQHHEDAGEHRVTISARELGLTSGLYFLRATAGGETASCAFRVIE